MLTIYLDESRQSDPNSFMCVAGFLGDEEQWKALAPRWKAALGSRRALHMSTLRLHSKPGRARQLLGTLGPIPHELELLPFYAAVKTGDYLDILAESKFGHKMPGYAVCLHAIIVALKNRIPAGESIKIVCETQKQYEPIATFAFDLARKLFGSDPANPLFSGIEFIPKGSSVLTQPADFLAFTIVHWCENPNSEKSKLCSPILGPSGFVWGAKLDRKMIRGIMSQIREKMGEYW